MCEHRFLLSFHVLFLVFAIGVGIWTDPFNKQLHLYHLPIISIDFYQTIDRFIFLLLLNFIYRSGMKRKGMKINQCTNVYYYSESTEIILMD